MSRRVGIRPSLAIGVRPIALCLAVIVVGASVSGCGVTHVVLGIHEAPKANEASASLTLDQAKAILTRDFTAAQQGDRPNGPNAQTARKTAYTGEGLRAANARVKLARLRPTAADSRLLAPQGPRLLAVSRGFGHPRVIVAQTVGSDGGLPVLHLLTSPNAATPYRISGSATMLLNSSVKRFDVLTQGSPMVNDETVLAVGPRALMNAYASGLAFPAKPAAKPPYAPDAFSAQVSAKAAALANAVSAQATFSQVHKVIPSSVYAVRQASGDALVFGVIERTESLKVKKGQSVNTALNREFVLLGGQKRVTRAASITTLEFVVFAVPKSGGRATLVAASEQIVAGSGS